MAEMLMPCGNYVLMKAEAEEEDEEEIQTEYHLPAYTPDIRAAEEEEEQIQTEGRVSRGEEQADSKATLQRGEEECPSALDAGGVSDVNETEESRYCFVL
jgi:hypothetical protein